MDSAFNYNGGDVMYPPIEVTPLGEDMGFSPDAVKGFGRSFAKTCFRVCLALALIAWLWAPVDAHAEGEKIIAVNVSSETSNEVVLRIQYDYSGSKGDKVFIGAMMGEDGKPSSYYAVRPDRVQRGRGTATVRLGTAQTAPKWFTTNQLMFYMYEGGQEPFLKQTFRYAKTWAPPGTRLPPALPVAILAAPRAVVLPKKADTPTGRVERRILPDGVVELHYPDGTVKRVFKGGMDIQNPDGTFTPLRYASAQAPTPPSVPPDAQHASWLEAESGALLEIIRSLVGNDDASVSSYLAKEGQGLSEYEKIGHRTTTIQFLLTP